MPTDADSRIPVAQAARLFGLLADETRLRLLPALEYGGAEGIPPVGLAEALGMTPEAAGYHLPALAPAGDDAGRRERATGRARATPALAWSIRPPTPSSCAAR
jgi:hypothetical protein